MYDADAAFAGCGFRNNSAEADGGALHMYATYGAEGSAGALLLERCVFDSNVAGGAGGAVYVEGMPVVATALQLSLNEVCTH